MNKFYPNLSQEIKVGNMTLKNRVQFTPYVPCLVDGNGHPTADYVAFMGMQGRTGAGLITIGGTPVGPDKSLVPPGEVLGEILNINESDIPHFARLADEAHRYGAKLSTELYHVSGIGLTEYEGFDPVEINLAFTKERIAQLVEYYASTAQNCMKSGLDMVMIHCGHGCLLGSFLSPMTNKRTDEYGGSLENRGRFAREVFQAIRAIVGNKLNIEVRISGDELVEGGMRIDETITFLKSVEEYIDIAHFSTGLIIHPEACHHCLPVYFLDYGINVKYAEEAKKVLKIPVAVVGAIPTLDMAEEIVATGKADIVGMMRGLLADGQTVTKGFCGQSEEIRPCLRCSVGCGRIFIGKQGLCSVNPVVGRESRYYPLPMANVKKKVMIVGGGVAGMMAAQTAVQRGHEVVLFEKSDKLGGTLHHASQLSFKGDMRRYLDWNIRTTLKCGAEIYLNTEVTPDLVKKVNPEALMICVGAEDFVPNIEGKEHAISLYTAEMTDYKIGEKVVICGGGTSGSEYALELAKQGKKVTLVDMLGSEELNNGLFFMAKGYLMEHLQKTGVKLRYHTKINKFSPEGVEVTTPEGNVELLSADTMIMALGFKPLKNIADTLKDIVTETYVVGDCNQVADIHTANHQAFNIAVEL